MTVVAFPNVAAGRVEAKPFVGCRLGPATRGGGLVPENASTLSAARCCSCRFFSLDFKVISQYS